jgi:hypothetical protein
MLNLTSVIVFRKSSHAVLLRAAGHCQCNGPISPAVAGEMESRQQAEAMAK